MLRNKDAIEKYINLLDINYTLITVNSFLEKNKVV